MEELTKINQEFNESIDDSFSLTKMFKKNGLLSKSVNTILTLSIAFGAMKGVSEIVENFDSPSQHYALVKEAQSSFNDVTVITADNIKDIANAKEDNIYQVEGNDQFIVAAYDKNFEIQDSNKNNIINELIELNKIGLGKNPHATHGLRLNNTGVPFSEMINFSFKSQDKSDMGYLVLQEDYFNNQFTEEEKDKYSLLLENDNLYLFAHELNHITESQFNYDQAYEEKGEIILDHVLAREISSDLFASLIIIKTNDYDLEQSSQLLSELSERRKDYLVNHNDFDHSTHLGLDIFKEAINENPTLLDQVKKSSLNKLSNVSMNFGENVFDKINEYYASHEALSDIKNDDTARFVLLSAYEPSEHDNAVIKIGAIKALNQIEINSIDDQEHSLLANLESENTTNDDNELSFENKNKIKKPKI